MGSFFYTLDKNATLYFLMDKLIHDVKMINIMVNTIQDVFWTRQHSQGKHTYALKPKQHHDNIIFKSNHIIDCLSYRALLTIATGPPLTQTLFMLYV